MSGLQKYDVRSSRLFNFNYTTDNPTITSTAASLITGISANTGKKDDVKIELMVKFLLNFYLGYINADMTTINLSPKYYSKIPKRYRLETESYAAVKNIVDALEAHGYIIVYPGFKNYNDNTGRLTALKPTSKLIRIIRSIKLLDFETQRPKETIVLRDADKNLKDYTESADTKKWRADLKRYNEFLQKQSVTLDGLTARDIKKNTLYFRNNKLVYTMNVHTLSPQTYSSIPLHYLHLYRVFNIDFKHGGRFYGGVENIPSVLRQFIKINGSRTVELDYASYQIRMLYHKLKIDYTQDAYTALVTPGGLYKREIFKIVALVILNAKDRPTAVKSLRQKFINTKLLPSKETTDIKLNALIDTFIAHHARINKYFFKGQGLKLQFIDSQITNEILKYFTKKKILLLSIHDSFIIESQHEDILRKIMIQKYKAKFRYKPQIT